MSPDLIVLDLLLPVVGGLEICRRLRPGYAGPILILTALGEELDEVLGLELGADDYLMKPVRPRVLLARIHAMLRRTRTHGSSASSQSAAESQPIAIGDLWVDSPSREARFAGGLRVDDSRNSSCCSTSHNTWDRSCTGRASFAICAAWSGTDNQDYRHPDHPDPAQTWRLRQEPGNHQVRTR